MLGSKGPGTTVVEVHIKTVAMQCVLAKWRKTDEYMHVATGKCCDDVKPPSKKQGMTGLVAFESQGFLKVDQGWFATYYTPSVKHWLAHDPFLLLAAVVSSEQTGKHWYGIPSIDNNGVHVKEEITMKPMCGFTFSTHVTNWIPHNLRSWKEVCRSRQFLSQLLS